MKEERAITREMGFNKMGGAITTPPGRPDLGVMCQTCWAAGSRCDRSKFVSQPPQREIIKQDWVEEQLVCGRFDKTDAPSVVDLYAGRGECRYALSASPPKRYLGVSVLGSDTELQS